MSESSVEIEEACGECSTHLCWWSGFAGDCPKNKELRGEE